MPSSSSRSAMRFRRLGLRNWRNFVELDVALQRRAFLVGANASGKSNLLDIFRFLRDVASSGGGFEEAVRSRGGVSRIRSLAASRDPSVEIRVTVGDAIDEWRYLLRFRQEPRGQRRAYVEEEKVWRGGDLILDRPDDGDKQDRARLTQTHLEQITANVQFRNWPSSSRRSATYMSCRNPFEKVSCRRANTTPTGPTSLSELPELPPGHGMPG